MLSNVYGAATSGQNTGIITSHLIRLDHDTPHHILTPMLGQDRVHPYGADTMEQFLTHRISPDEEHNRMAWAKTDPDGKWQAMIYAHLYDQPFAYEADTKGAMSSIVRSPARRLEGPVSVVGFYTVSKNPDAPKEGNVVQDLIYGVYADLRNNPLTAKADYMTVSPIRCFDAYCIFADESFADLDRKARSRQIIQWNNDIEGMKKTDDGRKRLADLYAQHVDPVLAKPKADRHRLVLEYLSHGADPVQNLHMANGGVILRIMDEVGDSDGRCQMGINYGYIRGEHNLTENAASYKASGRIVGLVSEYVMTTTETHHLYTAQVTPAWMTDAAPQMRPSF